MPNTPQGFFDTATGAPVTQPDGNALTTAFLEGKVAPKKGAQVPIVHPETGKVVNVASADLQTAISQGATLPSPDQIKVAEAEARLGPEAHGLLATTLHTLGGPGAARGLTMGGSDLIAKEVAGLFAGAEGKRKVTQYLNDIKTVHPVASAVSEMGGAVAGAFAGQAGGAARLLPAAALDVVGGGAAALGEGAAVGALGRGLAGRLGAGVAGGVARGAVEGGLLGLAQQTNEHILGNDPNLTAEKLLASAGHGAMVGGAAGGLFGGLGAVGREALNKAAPALSQFADRQTVRSLGGDIKDIRRLAKIGGGDLREGERRVAEYMRRNNLVGALNTIEDIAPKVEADFAKRTEELLAFHKNYGSHATIDTSSFLNKVDAEITKPLWADPATRVYADRVKAYTDLMADKFAIPTKGGGTGALRPMTLEEAWTLRKGLDRTVAFDALDPGIATAEKAKIRHVFEDHIEQGITQFGKKLETAGNTNGALIEQYKEVKRNYRIAATLNDAIEKSEIRNLKNNALSLTDRIATMGGAGSAVGALLSGHPLAAAGALASGFAWNQVRRRGNSTAAYLSDRIGQLGLFKRAVGDVDNIVTKGVDGFFNNLGGRSKVFRPGASFTGKGGLEAIFKAAVENTKASDPTSEKTLTTWAGQTEHIQPHAPDTHAALAAQMARTSMFLNGKLPPDPSRGINSTPYKGLSDQAKHTYMLYYKASTDPLSVVTSLQDGTVRPEQVEALKTNYPGMYAELQQKVLEHVALERGKGNEVPYQKLAQMAVLFGTREVDPSFSPDRVNMLQAVMQPTQAPTKNPVGRPTSKPVEGYSKMVGFSTQLSRLNKVM